MPNNWRQGDNYDGFIRALNPPRPRTKTPKIKIIITQTRDMGRHGLAVPGLTLGVMTFELQVDDASRR